MSKRGRPSIYTPALAKEICDRLAKGASLRSICKDEHMPDESTVREWAVNDTEGFYPHYARSRDFGLDAMAEESLDIADTRTTEADDVAHRRLQVDTRKWFLSKLAPKRYGDRSSLELSGADGGPIQISEADRVSKLAAMLAGVQVDHSDGSAS